MKYFERNEAALQSEKDTLEKRANEWGNNAPMLYPKNGSTMVRILPPYNELGVFFHQISKHYIKVGGNKAESFVCPQAMANMPCAICAKGQELTDSRDEMNMKFARENLRPRAQYLYNVLCYSGPADNKGNVPEFGKVYVLETGVMVHRQIITLDQDAATGWADITNLETGANLIIKRTGSGFDTKYEVHPHGAGQTNLFNDLQARGVDPNSLQLFNLEEVYAIPPEEKLMELVASLNITGGAFSAPSPRPVMQTVSPAAAAGAPPAPAVATPVPAAAPVPAPQVPGVTVEPPSQVTQPNTTVPAPPVGTGSAPSFHIEQTTAMPSGPETTKYTVVRPPVPPPPAPKVVQEVTAPAPKDSFVSEVPRDSAPEIPAPPATVLVTPSKLNN